MTAAQVLTPQLLRRLPLPEVAGTTDKNGRGKVLVVGGSLTSAGAPMLSGLAALRTGAGKVLLAVPDDLASLTGVCFPEAGMLGFALTSGGDPDVPAAAGAIVPQARQSDAVLIGPGFMEAVSAENLAITLLESVSGPTFVIDGMSIAGLRHRAGVLAQHRGRVIITPHAGEMAHLIGVARDKIEANSEEYAQRIADELACLVVLKGPRTVIAQPDGPLYAHEGSIPGLATSGSGDVLAGAAVGLLARGANVLTAALWSVYLHAQAGQQLSRQLAPLGYLARELPAQIPGLMHALSPQPAPPG